MRAKKLEVPSAWSGIIRAKVERTYLSVPAGGDDDRDAGPGADLADDLPCSMSGSPVEENQIRALGRDDRKCFFSHVCGGNAANPVCGQGGGDEVADVFHLLLIK